MSSFPNYIYIIPYNSKIVNYFLVEKMGIEPICLAAAAFETALSAYSSTSLNGRAIGT